MSQSPLSTQAPSSPTRLDRLAGLAIGLAAAALVGLVLVQGWQVFARYVMNDSPSWTEPFTVLLLSIAMGFGAAAGVHDQRHFRFNLLAEAAGPGLHRVLEAMGELVVIGIGAWLAVGALFLWWDGLGVRMAGAPLPQGSAFLPLGLSGALMVVFAGHRLWRSLRRKGA
jgi:TRAP-type C4-dicarboxylate transport system permease small subunit